MNNLIKLTVVSFLASFVIFQPDNIIAKNQTIQGGNLTVDYQINTHDNHIKPRNFQLSNQTFIVRSERREVSITYYVSDCGLLAASNCKTGNDSNDGLSEDTPWKTYSRARLQWSKLNPGDSILFARGGSYEVVGNTQWVNSKSNTINPIIVSDYKPNWGIGTEKRPIFIQNQDTSAFNLSDGGAADVEQGYIFENLDIQCKAPSNLKSTGFYMFNDVNDVLLENIVINGCGIGVHSAGSTICTDTSKCDGTNDRIIINNVTVINSKHQGFLGKANGLIISNSFFSNNGSKGQFNHNIYLAGGNNIRIINNTLTHSSIDSNGYCQSASIAVHGVVDDLLIENNVISEDLGKARGGCWGISVDAGYNNYESFSNVIIRENHVINVGNIGIGLSACDNCTIENNNIIQEQTIAFTAIDITLKTDNANSLPLNSVTVGNNSIYFGLLTYGTAIEVESEGNNHQIVGNNIQYDGTGKFNCLALEWSSLDNNVADYNTCSYDRTLEGYWNAAARELASWQSNGFGQNSRYLNPKL